MNCTETEGELSRRDMLITGGKMAAGAAIASMAVLSAVKSSAAYENTSAATSKYVKLDPHEVAQTTYENYFRRWCASSVIAGFAETLKKKGAAGLNDFPIDAYRWGTGASRAGARSAAQ